ncbi:toll-Interleukin receptor [Pseudomonas putida]|nr:toll-Interleukin receptor [Pseudomonas putida]
MKIFISWSGNRSKAVAEVLSDWIKCVLQASEPWISTRHIDRGSLWFTEINEKLRDISVGIVCLTQENKDRPWILFESGALAKGLSSNRVCTFLVDLQPGDLTDPLAQFNHTMPGKSGVWELVRTLNSCLVEKSLDERVLEKAFEVYWPIFETDFETALAENEPEKQAKPRPKDDVMMEILSVTRDMSRRVGIIESQQKKYSSSHSIRPRLSRNDVLLSLRAGMGVSEITEKAVKRGVDPDEVHFTVNEVLMNEMGIIRKPASGKELEEGGE